MYDLNLAKSKVWPKIGGKQSHYAKTFIAPGMCLTYFGTQNILHTKYMYWYMINSEEIN